MERERSVLMSLSETHVGGRNTQDAGLDSLGPLDNGAELATRRTGAGVPVAVAGVLENDDGLGAASGLGAVVGVELGLEVGGCNGMGRRDQLLGWKLGG